MPRFYELEGEEWVTSNAKRRLDVVLAGLSLPVAMPIAAAAIVASRVWDGKDTIFTQTRVGQYGELFEMDKIRTMKPSVPGGEASTCDEITALGRLLRPLAIDEIPQLFDVLEGRMSFTGPRAKPESVIDDMHFALGREKSKKWDYVRYVQRPGGAPSFQVTNRLELANKSIALDRTMLRLQGEMEIYDFDHASFSYDAQLLGRAIGAGIGVLIDRESAPAAIETEQYDS
jgi:lipopolysaccharide/colanic/teichoic acid biosynthesis glycosyltransferase